jgi:HNH endonuclease
MARPIDLSSEELAAAWERIQARCIEGENGCLLWTGPPTKSGHGQIAIHRWPHMVHRVAYTHLVGPIPDPMYVEQSCGNKLCVRASHLRVVSPSGARGVRRIDYDSPPPPCPKCGGERQRSARRKRRAVCRSCVREYEARYRAKKKAAQQALAPKEGARVARRKRKPAKVPAPRG